MKIEHFATSPRDKRPLGDSIANVEDIEAWQLEWVQRRFARWIGEPVA